MPISKDNIRISITIPRIINEKLKIIAGRHNRTVSGFVAILIIKYIEKNLPDDD